MIILFLTRRFLPKIGGVEKHSLEVAKGLINRGHSVTVVTENSGLNERSSIEGITIYRIPVGGEDWFKKFRIWEWLYRNKNLIRSADIVHAHDVYFWYLPFRFLFPSKPTFITFHGYETVFPPAKNAILVRKISELLAKGNICVGRYIEKWYGTHPTFITYGGINVINPRLEVKRQIKKIKIVYLGRLEKDNGGEVYISAFSLLRKRRIDFEFTAVGDGSMRKAFEQFGMATGFIKDTQKYIVSADIILASSYLSILEAFAAKKFVVSVYTNSLKKDYLEMTPFGQDIFIAKNAEQVADVIKKFNRKSKSIKNKIENTYNWVKSQTWDEVTREYLELWRGSRKE